MNKFTPYAGIAVLVLATFVSGLIQGKLTNRFGTPADMDAAAERLAGLKKVLAVPFGERGQWRMINSSEMSSVVINTLECREYINASFVNSEVPNLQVDGFIVLGPSGPISVHTPEVCYDSRAYERKEDRERIRIFPQGPQEDEFWGLTMRSNDVNADILRVFYAWTTNGPWTAPESPRMTYGGENKLLKMQLAVKLPSDANLNDADACKLFLQSFLPVVNGQLFDIPAE